MLFVHIANNEATAISAEVKSGEGWQSRWDWANHARAIEVAALATTLSGKLHIGIDNGPCISPRFDVIEAPVAGEPVSYSFNGDSYPDGVVTHVTKGSLKVVKTSTGSTYYRRGNTGRWMKAGGTWSLIHGHVTERNPHI